MELKEIIVSTCAIVGAILGVLNLMRSYLTDSERATLAIYEGDERDAVHPGLVVVNRSPFPITIIELGVVLPDGQIGDVGLRHGYIEINALPRRIEARHSHAFIVDLRGTIARQVHKPEYTFARTALGLIVTDEGRLQRWRRLALEFVHLRKKVF
jgi:hypothetical protein